MTRGRFVVLEGGEGSGKSTQARRLADALGAEITREPGGTEVGERVREVLLHGGDVTARGELLLFAAARAELVLRVIEPALRAGRHVVSDRFSASTLAYQGYGRGLDLTLVRAVSCAATGGLEPDLNVLLDVPAEIAASRRSSLPDRIEAADGGFHERVVAGFAELVAADPERWSVVDALGTVDEVSARVLAAVSVRLGLEVPAAPP